MKKCGHLQVFENKFGDMVILDKEKGIGVCFDETLAEKLCKCIMEKAQEIRG